MRSLRLSHISAGFIAVLVGYTGSVALVFQAATAAGADEAVINSWLMALGLAMGITSIGLSLYYRMPVLTAWSTPGAALLASSLLGNSIEQATAAFIFAAALTVIFGLTGWFRYLADLIPGNLAAALLAGVLINISLNVFTELEQHPMLILGMLISYLLAKRFLPRYAILLVLITGTLMAWQLDLFTTQPIDFSLASPKLIWPEFDLAVMLGVGLPLFLVTMSSQNITGLSALRANGYHPNVSPIISSTGITNLLLAPFGCFSIGLAAITAAICMTDDADNKPERRYLASVCAGFFYLLTALFGTAVVGFFAISPPALTLSLAGIALLSTVANSLHGALDNEQGREAALLTFMITASGLTLWDINSAFWGLAAGLIIHQLQVRN